MALHPLDALGNPFRREILRELRNGPRSVGDLAAQFPVSRPAVSRHLAVLEDAGLVTPHPKGARTLYALRPQGFSEVRAYLDEFWDAALARLGELASKDPR